MGSEEIYRFCHVCDKVTVHKRESAFVPYTCREKHDPEKASRICGSCGKEQDPRAAKIARGLGVNYALCPNCNTAKHR